MIGNLPVTMASSFSKITVFNVGRANCIKLEDKMGAYFVDAGIENRGPSNVLAKVFFLTHWHYDHYSLFTKKKNVFGFLVAPKLKKSSSILASLYSKKASNISSSNRLFIQPADGIVTLSSAFSCFAFDGKGKKENNHCIVYCLDSARKKYKISSNSISACGFSDGFFVFPGDMDARYLTLPAGWHWQFLVSPHHGSISSSKWGNNRKFFSQACLDPVVIFSTSYSNQKISGPISDYQKCYRLCGFLIPRCLRMEK